MAYFAAELSRSLAPSTVSVYLSAVASLHRQAGLKDPTRHNPILQLAKRGIRRTHTAPTSTPRSPITSSVLANLLTAITRSRSLCRHDRRMLAAAFTLAFFGFLRISEFAVPSRRLFDHHLHPTRSSIQWSNNHFTFHLSHSKTDQFARGQSIRIPCVGGPICPFKAMSRYLARHITSSRTPLFSFASGHPLTRRSCLHHLRRLLRASKHCPGGPTTPTASASGQLQRPPLLASPPP